MSTGEVKWSPDFKTEPKNPVFTGSYRLSDVMAQPPEPGERCALCNRRRNKPRQTDSPDTREMRIKLPAERMEWAEEAFDALQEVVGADPYSYPRGVILEALLLLGGQEREELKRYFQGDKGAL